MRRLILLAALIVGGLVVPGTVHAGFAELASGNDQEGDISSETEQTGSANSGDAVGGQVVGVVSSGDASVDSTNRSEDVDIETGEATATNNSDSFTGQLAIVAVPTLGSNEQVGDNEAEIAQAAEATSGDGVGGTVIGVVTSAGGSADVVAANTSEDVDIETGDAFATNDADPFTGQLYINIVFEDLEGQDGENFQEGDNSLESDQSASASTGDGVGGQVLGIVSAGDAAVDATNSSTDVDIETGDASSANTNDPFTGQLYFRLALIGGALGENELEGDNSTELNQAADSTSGDGVGGQVIGAVTTTGGSADIVAANTSEDVDIETGDAAALNESDSFVGQLYVNIGLLGIGGAYNDQYGDNSLESDQTASAATGDGVGGQVLGIVSAGDASVDATNESTDVDVETGDAFANNFSDSFVGQSYVNIFGGLMAGGENYIDGDISNELSQSSNAASGDAVAGQVAGVVTSAGGSADLVLANTSEDVDLESGTADFVNSDEDFVGQQILVIGGFLISF